MSTTMQKATHRKPSKTEKVNVLLKEEKMGKG